MSISDEIAAYKREIARLQAELETLESCLEDENRKSTDRHGGGRDGQQE